MQQPTESQASHKKDQNTNLIELAAKLETRQIGSDETNVPSSNQASLLLSSQKSSLITSSLIKDAVSTALSQFDLKEVLVPKKPNQSDVDKKAAISRHIKRPMNAFMVWAQAARRALSKTHPTLHNAQLSKTLGNMWHQLKEDQKLPFMEEANRLRDEHKNENPGYKYQPKRRPKMAFLSQTIASTISQNANQTNMDSKLDVKVNSNNATPTTATTTSPPNNHVIIDSKFKHKYRKVLNKMEHTQKSTNGNNNNENCNNISKKEMNGEKDEYPATKKIKFNQYSLNKINKQLPPPQPQSSVLSLDNHNHHNSYYNGHNNNTTENHYHQSQNFSQQQDNRLHTNQGHLQSAYSSTTLNSTSNSNNLSSLNDESSDTSSAGGGGAGFKILSEFKLNNTSLLHNSHNHLHHSQVLTPPLSSSSATTTANSSFQFPNEHMIYPNFTSSTSSSPTSNPYTQSQMSHLFQYQHANNGSYLSNNSSSSSSLSSQTNVYNQMHHSSKKIKNKHGQAIMMNEPILQRNRTNDASSDNENEENNDDDDEYDEGEYNLSNGVKSNPIMSQVNNQTLEDISDEDLDENGAYIQTNNENDLNNNHQLEELDNMSNVNDSNLVLNGGLNAVGAQSTSPSSQTQQQQPQHEPLATLTQFYINSRLNNPYVPSNTVSNQALNSYTNTHMFSNSGFNEQGNSHYDRHHSYSPYQNQLVYGGTNNIGNNINVSSNFQQSAFDAYQQMPLQSTMGAHMALSAYKQTYLHQIEAQQQAYSNPSANYIYQLQQAATNANDSSNNSSSPNNVGKRPSSNSPSFLINQTFDQSNPKSASFISHNHHNQRNNSHSNSPIENQFRLIENIENTDDRQSLSNLTSTQSIKINGSNSPSSFSSPLLPPSNYTDNNQIKHSSFVPFTNNYA